jgi:uncharacterized membrane protein YesL
MSRHDVIAILVLILAAIALYLFMPRLLLLIARSTAHSSTACLATAWSREEDRSYEPVDRLRRLKCNVDLLHHGLP